MVASPCETSGWVCLATCANPLTSVVALLPANTACFRRGSERKWCQGQLFERLVAPKYRSGSVLFSREKLEEQAYISRQVDGPTPANLQPRGGQELVQILQVRHIRPKRPCQLLVPDWEGHHFSVGAAQWPGPMEARHGLPLPPSGRWPALAASGQPRVHEEHGR